MRPHEIIQDLASLVAAAMLVLTVLYGAPIVEWLMSHAVPA